MTTQRGAVVSRPSLQVPVNEVFRDFARAIHAAVPENHAVDLHDTRSRERAFCGEHGRVEPTRQGRCPACAGYVVEADYLQRMRDMAKRLEAA